MRCECRVQRSCRAACSRRRTSRRATSTASSAASSTILTTNCRRASSRAKPSPDVSWRITPSRRPACSSSARSVSARRISSVGIIKDLIREKGIHCLFCDYRELLKSIQNSYNPSVQATEMEILRPVFDAEVLVLDELGAVRSTEWVFDTVNYILNSRYNDNKTTIITTNFPDRPEQDEVGDDNLAQLLGRRSRRAHARRWAIASANACGRACTRCARRSKSKAPTIANTPSAHNSSGSARRISCR